MPFTLPFTSSFMNHDMYLLFQGGNGGTELPASRVLGPFRVVSNSSLGIWVTDGPAQEPVRVAARSLDRLHWIIDEFPDVIWTSMGVLAPTVPTTAQAIQDEHGWIFPRMT